MHIFMEIHGKSAPGDSLQAIKGHRYRDLLADPGEADVTAHVDFAAIAAATANNNVRVSGPVTQSAFLTALGIEARAAQLLGGAKLPPADLRPCRSL